MKIFEDKYRFKEQRLREKNVLEKLSQAQLR